MLDFVAPALLGLIDFVGHYWASLLLIAAAVVVKRTPRLKFPPARAAYAIVFVLSLATSLLTYHFRGPAGPPAWFEDDYGYLLTADTFMHGRLANPPHPMRKHFEAMYILQEPKYISMYLPGNPLVLAFGRLIGGRALIGVEIVTALAAIAILWALRAWVAEEWAFALACVIAVHPVMAEWGNSYHSGSLSALGGALMAGAVGRMRGSSRAVDAIALGGGAVALMFTRPYEGFVIAAIFTVFAIARAPLLRLAPAALIVALGFAALMADNVATTGHPLELPYMKFNERYLSAPNFIWQSAGPMPQYDNFEFARTYRQFRGYYFRSRNNFAETARNETALLLQSAVPDGPLWIAALLPLVALFFRRDAIPISIALLIALASLLQITWWTQLHYAAPSTALFAVAYALGITRIDAWRPALSRAALLALAIGAVAGTVQDWRTPHPIGARELVNDAVTQHPGPHLVLVPERCTGLVYNGAEIDRQRVIWARDIGNNDDLLRRYADRTAWHLDSDCTHAALMRQPLRDAPNTAWEKDPFVP